MGWHWDPSLYEGAASHYARGRVAYPRALADLLAAELGLDGSGRLLDVGCGPGSLTLLLAPWVAEATDRRGRARGRADPSGRLLLGRGACRAAHPRTGRLDHAALTAARISVV